VKFIFLTILWNLFIDYREQLWIVRRPYSRDDVHQDEEKKIFNYRLSRARNTVENTFGILARKFRIFERKLNVSHEHSVTIIMATCCLHDTCHWTESDLQVSLSNVEGLRSLRRSGGTSRQDALEVRECFKQYFSRYRFSWMAAKKSSSWTAPALIYYSLL
jgi:hypothetical protein